MPACRAHCWPNIGDALRSHVLTTVIVDWVRLAACCIFYGSDTREDATTRLSAWLLYLQKYHIHSSSSTAGNNSNGFWRAWLTVLPRAEEATNANGFWTPAELQQLQLEPYKVGGLVG